MDYLSADSLPWLGQPQRMVREALHAGRLPHSTLLLSAPGLGAEMLAHWVAAVALCGAPHGRPCRACASCTLLRAGSHPDLHVVRLEQDAKQIKVDQIRELIGELTLKSYRGGYKVGIIEAAETLNANGANALLKTLEEPSGMALLVLVARPTHRLPATIASRCMKLILRPPPTEQAIAWLRSQDGGAEQRWDAALALAGGAPLLALELGTAGAASLGAEMEEDLRSIGAGRVDVTLLADRWAKGDLGLRLLWLENWITCRVRAHLGGAESNQTAERARLPGPLLKVKIRALFDLLDGARELRRLASTGVNQQLALEALLIGGGAALK
jgi:DNA polymerase-3 subunit delta'